MAETSGSESHGRGALVVGAGILLSRLSGLIRMAVFSAYFATTAESAAFQYAQRIPNILQNLFGEGVLSASFIPVYAALLGKGDEEEADRVASAVFALLGVFIAIVVVLGVAFAPFVVDLIVSRKGVAESTRALTIELVRIIFPGMGLMVGSAWCLGILNSHHKFFLSYVSPVVWNFAQIVVLLFAGPKAGPHGLPKLAHYLSYGLVVGSFLQFAVQLPKVLSLLGRFRPVLTLAGESIRQVLRGLGPVLLSRGIVQVSAYIDLAYSSYVGERASSALSYAQLLALLPISLFGMAVSAAELPAMSRATGSVAEVAGALRGRINSGLERIAFFVVPSVAAFLFLGDVVSGVLFQRGIFRADDARLVWYVLIGSTIGLLAQTFGRLYSSAFYAMKDTKTPFYFAAIRMALTAGLAYVSVVYLPGWLGVPKVLGAVGITATTGFAAWIEFALLRRGINKRVGETGLKLGRLTKLWIAAGAGALVGLGIKVALARHFGSSHRLLEFWGGKVLPAPHLSVLLTAIAVLVPFGLVYLAVTYWLKVSEVAPLLKRLRAS